MARLDVTGIDDLLSDFNRWSDPVAVNQAAVKAVDAASPGVAAEMSSAIAGVEHGPYATGSVSRSVKATKAKTNAYGVFSASRPTGRDKKGKRNAEKAAYLQYGTPTMPARPWAEKATRKAEEKAAETLENVFCDAMGIDREG